MVTRRVVSVEARPEIKEARRCLNTTEMLLCRTNHRVDNQMTFLMHLGMRHLGLTHRTTETQIIRKGIGAKYEREEFSIYGGVRNESIGSQPVFDRRCPASLARCSQETFIPQGLGDCRSSAVSQHSIGGQRQRGNRSK